MERIRGYVSGYSSRLIDLGDMVVSSLPPMDVEQSWRGAFIADYLSTEGFP